jgi:hypothetical protein
MVKFYISKNKGFMPNYETKTVEEETHIEDDDDVSIASASSLQGGDFDAIPEPSICMETECPFVFDQFADKGGLC